MSSYAKVNNGLVETVIEADSNFIKTLMGASSETWIETSDSIMRNYAGIGYSYDATRNAFIPPRIFDSWTLDEGTCQWIPPIPYPDDGRKYQWDEVTQWDVVS